MHAVWVADGYTGVTGSAAALWQEQYGYDLSGRRTLRHQVRANASHLGQDFGFEYDRLDRLTTAWKGTRRKQEFARRASSQRWELDELGNWKSLTLDGNNDGVFTSATDSQTRRVHNGAVLGVAWGQRRGAAAVQRHRGNQPPR